MKKKKLLDDFELLDEADKPDDGPVHVGDYLEETTAPPPRVPEQKPVPKKSVPPRSAPEKKRSTEKVTTSGKAKPSSSSGRTRLNITDDQRDKLDDIVREMHRVGPERYLKASEVVDALINVLHDSLPALDMGMVRRRGKFGSQKHRMYREALAESIRVTIANHQGPE